MQCVVSIAASASRPEISSAPSCAARRASGRPAASYVAEHEARADGIGEVAIRAQLDVVAEPGGLLMRVRVATQPREQRNVEDDRTLILAELDVLGDSKPEDARPQPMLQRLPETEVRSAATSRPRVVRGVFRWRIMDLLRSS